MARKIYEESKIAEIAKRIREKTGGATTYTTAEMADGVAEVYDAGKKSEYDAFWDKFQTNGWKTNYAASFGSAWTVETFKPKYDIKIVMGAYAFAFNSLGVDLVAHLENLGVKLDLSSCVNAGNMFQASQFTRLGELCCTVGNWSNVFNGCSKLETIDEWGKPTEAEEIKGGLTTTFTNCTELKNIKVRGRIADHFDLRWCPLSHDSITNILSHLSDTTTWQVLTLSKSAVDKAFATGQDTYVFNDDDTELLNFLAAVNVMGYDVNFVSNGESYVSLIANDPSTMMYSIDGDTSTTAYQNGWTDEAYKTIAFADTSTIPVGLMSYLLKMAKKTSNNASTRNDGSTSPEWLAWVASKPNWTISLA